MTLGSGYRYLMESVAAGDGRLDMATPLTRYYAESGTPPGYFLGAGLSDLGGGAGIEQGSVVTDEQLFRLLGMCADPLTGEPLGRRPARQLAPRAERVAARLATLETDRGAGLTGPERDAALVVIDADERGREARRSRAVAGFDLTFSVPKSISVAWGLADKETKEVIVAVHHDAIARVLAYAEAEVLTSRSGPQGIVEEQITGVVATAFDHFDSRAGDPQLHSHVVVANRARSLSDGTWRTLDSRSLFGSVVALSELHQGILQDLLADRLGWSFDPRRRAHSAVVKHEVTGISDALVAEFSSRSRAIEAEKEVLVTRFEQSHGRLPTTREILRVREQATLATRPEKSHRSLEEMTAAWRVQAAPHVGADPEGFVAGLANERDARHLFATDAETARQITAQLVHDELAVDLAHTVEAVVATKRATFTWANVTAEVHRQLQAVRFSAPAERIALAATVTELVLSRSVLVTAPEVHHVPEVLSRGDGTSKLRSRRGRRYTTTALLEAEARLLEAGRDVTGPSVRHDVVTRVAAATGPSTRRVLGLDQVLAIEHIATSGRVLDVLVGPAGSGKTTALRCLRRAWEEVHGRGSVIGLAPSASAAEVLSSELGIATENTAKWLYELRRCSTSTDAISRAELHASELVVLDEATLAGTAMLDTLVTHARERGAKVLLVGDPAQLSAIDAGGGFAMVVADRDDAPELVDVHRFHAPWERAASLALRAGEVSSIAIYEDNDRIREGSRAEMLDAVFDAWSADVAARMTSRMIAGDAASVASLNARARTVRVATGEVADTGVPIAGGESSDVGRHGAGLAGVGDLVVTRLNRRSIRVGDGWVRNGDEWVVLATDDDGTMTVRRAGSPGGGEGEGPVHELATVHLPADYVCDHVELGYASTIYRVQGATLDTAHALLGSQTTREELYVAATRGRHANHLYVDVTVDPDPDTSHGEMERASAVEVLERVLATSGAEHAATVAIAQQSAKAASIATLAAEYQAIATLAQKDRFDAVLRAAGLDGVVLVTLHDSPAYGALLTAFRDADARGLDLEATLPLLVASRSLEDAEDIAAVLHHRVDRWINTNSRRRREPRDARIAGIVARARGVTDPDLARALDERVEAIEHRARELADAAIAASAPWTRAPWTRALGPMPTDDARRASWLDAVTIVAAYRDRWDVRTEDPLGSPARDNLEQLGQARDVRRAIERARGTWTSVAPPRRTVEVDAATSVEHAGRGHEGVGL